MMALGTPGHLKVTGEMRDRDLKTSTAAPPAGRRQIWYWGVTSVLALECIVGGIMGALRLEPFLGVIRHLGYPDYACAHNAACSRERRVARGLRSALPARA